MEESMSLRDVFRILSKYKILIIIFTIAAGLTAGLISYYVISPVYLSSSQILVNQARTQGDETANQNIEANLQLIGTYSDIIKTPGILYQVKEQLGLNLTVEQLNEQLTVTSNENSQIINVAVRDTDYERAVTITNTTIEVFSEEVKKLLNVNNVSIVSPATLTENPTPVSPNVLLNTVIAALAGLLFGSGLAFLLNYMNTTIRNDLDVEKMLNIPVLAEIPVMTENRKTKEVTETAFEERKA